MSILYSKLFFPGLSFPFILYINDFTYREISLGSASIINHNN